MNNSFPPARTSNAEAVIRADRVEGFPLHDHALAQSIGYNYAGAQESILRYYWRIMWKRRLTIMAIMLLFLLAGIALAMFTQRMYSAQVSLEVAREAAKVIDIDKAQPQSGVDQEFYQTQYALLKSRSLAEAVARDLRLANDENFLVNYSGDPSTLPASRDARNQIATGIILADTEVIPVRMSSIANVRYTSPNPEMAAKVANSLAENFIESNLARRFNASSYARDFLQNQLARVRQRLELSERQAVAYATRNQIINVGPTSTTPGERSGGEQSLVGADLNAINAALAEARTSRIEAENRYRQAARSQPSESLQNTTLNGLRQERAALSAQYQKQLSDFGPEYPAVRALSAQISELDKQVDSETARINSTVTSNLQAQYRAALANEQELAGRVQQLKGGVLDLRRRSIQYNIFQREVDTNRALYDALLQRYKEVGIAGGVGTNNISVVDTATVPGKPFRPDIRLNIMLSLLIGTILGALAALLLEQLDESAVAPDDFQNKLGIPLLGTVPVTEKGILPRQALEDSKAPLSEAYLSVLTGLQFSTTHGTPKTFLVTSTQPSEGKSTTSFALARSLARVGRKVLLIDGDMRNPSLHKTIGVPNRGGLSNLLISDGTLEEHVLPSEVINLSILTAGHLPPNPAELLAGNMIESILASASAVFDHVIVDAPPVLGLADAPLLARSVEATVFVLEAGRTRTSQARGALQRLMAVRASIAGAVLTKFDTQRAGYGYGYGYDYSYGT